MQKITVTQHRWNDIKKGKPKLIVEKPTDTEREEMKQGVEVQ
jgi:hypothetical protein